VDLKQPSRENIEYIIRWIQKRLSMVNTAVLDPAYFDLTIYEDLYDIYRMMEQKERFSISEIEAIVAELGSLRSKNRVVE
jgi:uncharacterized protein YfkK (UPF0435 family)